ncbi:MAG: KAP family NTPase [Oscillospiraceae bacterium]|nr:KAP family NTPase [Oscillospiraceae bacterium]
MKYKFIPNKPVGNDLFTGQSHDNLANTIVDNMKNNSDIQTIGIEGNWGTGKSNLIRLIQKKLEDSGDKKYDYNFFVYDVWGHSEDRQRETILSELIDFLTQKDRPFYKKKDDINNDLKKLLSSKRDVSRTTAPIISIGVIFAMLTLLNAQIITILDRELDCFPVFLKILIAIWPILIVVPMFIRNLRRDKTKNNKKEKIIRAFKSTFHLFRDEPIHELSSEQTYEKSSSAGKFREWMKKIDKKLNNEESYEVNKLIIIFDNFDRVQDESIQNTWSMLNLFFNTESIDNKYDNISVIVPFDRSNIIDAFAQNSNDSKFVDDYINKTFDVVYRVVKPIMSEWKKYFKEKWNEAGLSVGVNEKELLWGILTFESFQENITPRNIIALINEIVAIKQVQDEVPERYIVLFIMNKKSILERPTNAILYPNFHGKLEYLYSNDADYPRFMAALIYQIDSETAEEVALQQEVEKSLVNGNKNRFIKLSETHVFSIVLLPAIMNMSGLDEPVRLLDSLDLTTSKISDVELSTIWDTILGKAMLIPITSLKLSPKDGIILKRVDNHQRELWLKYLIDSYYLTNDLDALLFSNSIDELNEIIKTNSLDIDIADYLHDKTVSAEQFFELAKSKSNILSDYALYVDERKLDSYLLDAEIIEFKDPSLIQELLQECSLPKFHESLKTKLSDGEYNSESLEILLSNIKQFWKEHAIKVEDLMQDQEIYMQARSADEDSNLFIDLLSLFLARGHKFSASELPFTSSLENDEEKFVKRVYSSLQHFVHRGELLTLSAVFTVSKLCKALVRMAVEVQPVVNRLNLEHILEEFENICVSNEVDPQKLIITLNGWIQHIKMENWSLEKIPNLFFRNAADNTSQLAKKAIIFATSHFNKLDKQGWINIFNENDKLCELIVDIKYKKWNSASREAIKEVLLEIVKSGETAGRGELLNKVVEKMIADNIALSSTYENIRDLLIQNRSINTDLFKFTGKNLFKIGNLEERAPEVMRSIFKIELLDNPECVRILYIHSTGLKEIIGKCKNNDTSDFKDGIRNRIDQDPFIAKLARTLGIRRYRKRRD